MEDPWLSVDEIARPTLRIKRDTGCRSMADKQILAHRLGAFGVGMAGRADGTRYHGHQR